MSFPPSPFPICPYFVSLLSFHSRPIFPLADDEFILIYSLVSAGVIIVTVALVVVIPISGYFCWRLHRRLRQHRATMPREFTDPLIPPVATMSMGNSQSTGYAPQTTTAYPPSADNPPAAKPLVNYPPSYSIEYQPVPPAYPPPQ